MPWSQRSRRKKNNVEKRKKTPPKNPRKPKNNSGSHKQIVHQGIAFIYPLWPSSSCIDRSSLIWPRPGPEVFGYSYLAVSPERADISTICGNTLVSRLGAFEALEWRHFFFGPRPWIWSFIGISLRFEDVDFSDLFCGKASYMIM